MASKSKASKPGGGHTSVSNKPEESLRAEDAEFFAASLSMRNRLREKPGKYLRQAVEVQRTFLVTKRHQENQYLPLQTPPGLGI